MLKLYCGTDRTCNSAKILSDITENAKKKIGGQILIVPEQYSHEAERALCRAGGDTISRYAEVLSFSRLAQRVFSLYGGTGREYLDGGGRYLTVCRAADQVSSRIKFFAAVLTKPDFLLQLAQIFEEFLLDCITPTDLQAAAKTQQGQFAQKLEELALLYESYLSVTKSGRGDPVTRLHQLKNLLQQEDYLADKTVYLDGFSDFTAVEQQIVEEMIVRAADVTAALRTDGSDLLAFETVSKTAKWLRKTAERRNILCTREMLSGNSERDGMIAAVLENLLRSSEAVLADETQSVCLHHAADAASECAFCAQKVQELTKKGCRYRDICIALADESYFAILKDVFDRAEMPAYLTENCDILTKPLFSALLASLRAAERLDFENVMEYLKSDLSPLDADAACRLERYAYIWNIRGSAWEKPFSMHPKGFGAPWQEDDERQLACLEMWRDAAMGPLLALKKDLASAQNTAQMLCALGGFIENVRLCETLREQEADCLQSEQLQKAQQMHQLYDILLDAMEQMAQILGDLTMPTERFIQLFAALLSQYQVGTIPSSVDQLQVGSIASFRHKSAKALIVLGAKDGNLPSYTQTNGILTDEERSALVSAGLTLAPVQIDCFTREMGNIHAALSLPSSLLMFSFSGETPSYLYTRVGQILPGCKKTTQAELTFVPDAITCAANACAGAQRQITSPAVLQAMYDLQQKTKYALTPMDIATVQGLYGKTLSLSASKIDCFSDCRLAFFLKYGLKAEPWKRASVDKPIFGTFVHYVLECTVREVVENGGFSAASDEKVLEIAKKHADEYEKFNLPDLQTRARRYGYLFSRNWTEIRDVVLDVAHELRQSRFVPADEELKFDYNGTLPPVVIEGKLGSSAVRGSVDRVDLYEQSGQYYLRVIDYKTGKKSFDYSDILLSHGLQMLIYLFALKNSGQDYYHKPLIPAGVLYVPARTEYESVAFDATEEEIRKLHQKNRRRKGLVLDDDATLSAMESAEEPVYLPYKISKGEKKGDLASREQLQMLEKFVYNAVRNVSDEIFSGKVEPNPIRRGSQSGACIYCEYQSVCHKDYSRPDYRDVKEISAEQFWNTVEGETNHG